MYDIGRSRGVPSTHTPTFLRTFSPKSASLTSPRPLPKILCPPLYQDNAEQWKIHTEPCVPI